MDSYNYDAVTIGILAPASSGKTTMANEIINMCVNSGLKVGYLGADGALYPGKGFRYTINPDTGLRDEHLVGPAIYDDVSLYSQNNY